MINRLLLILFFVSSFSILATAQGKFKATLTADGGDLVVSVTPNGGDITTDFSLIEFFVRTPYVAMPLTMSPIIVGTDFPGNIPMAASSGVVGGGFTTFQIGYPQVVSGNTETYLNGMEYELARMSVTGGFPTEAVFELISDLTTYSSYLTITSGGGVDLTYGTCIAFGTCPTESVFYGPGSSGSGTAFTVAATAAPVPLPVELNTFIGWNQDKINKLTWTTQSEENSSHFEIQKSANGEDFERIGNVDAAGNSASPIDYRFDDLNPFLGANYYRLKIIDLDGSYEYSEVILIKTNGKAAVKGFPNPFTNTVSFELTSPISGSAQISVYDIAGKQVVYLEREVEAGLSTQSLKLDNLAEGTYIAKVLLPGTSEFLTTKIIKNNQ